MRPPAMAFERSPAPILGAPHADDARELATWRTLAPRVDAALCELLAAKGDRAEPELVNLQHEIATLAGLPANTP